MNYLTLFFILSFISSCTQTLATCGSCPPSTVPQLPLPNVPIPVIGKPPVELPPVPVIGTPVPVIGKPPVELPPVPVIGKPPVDLPPVPVITPPSTKPGCAPPPPKIKPPCPPKPYHPKAKCPIDTIKLGACLDVLGAVVHVGAPAAECCPLIKGLTAVNAALCLCTTIKAKALGLKVYLPIALELLVTCGKKLPPGFKCP